MLNVMIWHGVAKHTIAALLRRADFKALDCDACLELRHACCFDHVGDDESDGEYVSHIASNFIRGTLARRILP